MSTLQSLLPQFVAASGSAYQTFGSSLNLHPGEGLSAFIGANGQPLNALNIADGFSASVYRDPQNHVIVAFEGSSFDRRRQKSRRQYSVHSTADH